MLEFVSVPEMWCRPRSCETRSNAHRCGASILEASGEQSRVSFHHTLKRCRLCPVCVLWSTCCHSILSSVFSPCVCSSVPSVVASRAVLLRAVLLLAVVGLTFCRLQLPKPPAPSQSGLCPHLSGPDCGPPRPIADFVCLILRSRQRLHTCRCGHDCLHICLNPALSELPSFFISAACSSGADDQILSSSPNAVFQPAIGSRKPM